MFGGSFWYLSLACVFYIAGAHLDHLDELPDCSGNSNVDFIGSSVYVSTLDGRVTALNSDAGGMVMWSIDTGPSPLLSSSIHKLELTNNGHWVRMIPSLSGGLYKFNGVNIEMLPVRADHLLQSSSFLLNDGLVISGGRETRIYSIALETGEVLYECSMKGCDNFKNISTNRLVIQRHTQTVRAIDIHSGNERWNFSVGQHDVKLASPSGGCQNEVDENSLDLDIKAIIPEGLVYAVKKSHSHKILWQHKFTSPVVAIWKMNRGEMKSVDLFNENVWPTFSGNTPNTAPLLYLGMHQKQLYIQESTLLQNNARTAGHLIESESRKKLQLPWKPVSVTSTALGVVTKPNAHSDDEDAPTTALSVLYASEYVNGNGYFLFSKNVDVLKLTKQCSPGEEGNITSAEDEFHDDPDTPIQIIVSLWYWWKEVLVISITTAVLVNLIVTQRVLQLVQEPVGKEVVYVEKPVTSERKHSSETQSSSNSLEESRNVQYSSRYLMDFEPIQCLGKGGFGVVFEAKNKIDDCNYAIKRIPLPNSIESRDRVLREVKALAKLDHQNIVRYFNAWMECPPTGWQEHQDSLHFNECRSDSGINGHAVTNMSIGCETSTEEEEESVVFSQKKHKFNNLSVHSKNSYISPENDSFIVFQNSNSDSTCEQVKLDMEDTSVSAESYSKQCTEREELSLSKELLEEGRYKTNSSGKVTSSPSRMYLYIQMQLCLKESLKEWLCENVSSRDRRKMLEMFKQIVQAVEYIHLEGLIHRDLKPSNIFFSMNGQIKVGDFGLVTTMTKNMMDELNETKSKYNSSDKHTARVGTQLYMSPEQLKGLPYDFKVDIYSLGVILFELLYPFSTQMERSSVLYALRSNIFPESFKREFHEEFALLCLMLSHDPNMRPTTFDIRARPPLADCYNQNKHL